MLKTAAKREGAAVDDPLRDKKLSSLELFSLVWLNLDRFTSLVADEVMRMALLIIFSVLLGPLLCYFIILVP